VQNKIVQREIGLAFWMGRVLEDCDRVSRDFAPDPVHDLRVALRRCRSIADGFIVIDPDKSWKKLKKASKLLFQSLGELRDAHVILQWVQCLGAADDPVTKSLQSFIAGRESDLKKQVLSTLQNFDRKKWDSWRRNLPRRAAHVRLNSAIFKHLALERWNEARELQRQALRNRSQSALHQLRIGLKRFRYTVENFLPVLHEQFCADLKELQRLLGEVHDLDVLWATAFKIRAFPDDASRLRWRERISQERTRHIESYRQKMMGRQSLWSIWRAQLPHGKQIHSAALARLKIWASFLDPNFRHSRHVADLALQLYDILIRETLIKNEAPAPDQPLNFRAILEAAALMHDVGRSHSENGHHKISARLIRKLTPPLGWSEQELWLAAFVARYHRGALPNSRHKAFTSLPPDQQAKAVLLAGILRLVNAFDVAGDGRISRLQARIQDGTLRIYVQGYLPMSPIAGNIASARHLLEVALRRPIAVRRLVNSKSSIKKPKPTSRT
jgi:CHAD domain-containing protein